VGDSDREGEREELDELEEEEEDDESEGGTSREGGMLGLPNRKAMEESISSSESCW
jgi:hypothetical protein